MRIVSFLARSSICCGDEYRLRERKAEQYFAFAPADADAVRSGKRELPQHSEQCARSNSLGRKVAQHLRVLVRDADDSGSLVGQELLHSHLGYARHGAIECGNGMPVRIKLRIA